MAIFRHYRRLSKFHDPAEIFNPVLLDQAYDSEDVGAVVYAQELALERMHL